MTLLNPCSLACPSEGRVCQQKVGMKAAPSCQAGPISLCAHHVCRLHSQLRGNAQVEAPCHCGKQTQSKRCSQAAWSCRKLCGSKLACGHRCPNRCHAGACPPCMLMGELSPSPALACFGTQACLWMGWCPVLSTSRLTAPYRLAASLPSVGATSIVHPCSRPSALTGRCWTRQPRLPLWGRAPQPALCGQGLAVRTAV